MQGHSVEIRNRARALAGNFLEVKRLFGKEPACMLPFFLGKWLYGFAFGSFWRSAGLDRILGSTLGGLTSFTTRRSILLQLESCTLVA